MKSKTIIALIAVTAICTMGLGFTPNTHAWKNEISYQDWGIGPNSTEEKVGCTSQPATWVDDAYMQIWHRHARCDEVTFHLTHGTNRETLEAWLQQVKLDKLKQIVTGHTVLDPWTNDIYYVKGDGVAHKINDWPTLMSWGLSINYDYALAVENYWVKRMTIGEPLSYTAGPYYSEVQASWDDASYDPDMPSNLKTEFLTDAHTHYGLLKYKRDGIFSCDSWGMKYSPLKYLDYSYANTLNSETRTNCNDW